MGLKQGVIQLIIFHRLKFEVSPPQEVTPYVGSTVSFSCVAKSDLRPVITWEKDIKSRLPVDSNILPNGTLVLHNIQKSHQGTYTCITTNALATIIAKVKVNSPRSISSCSTIRHFTSASGNYEIDPDGAGGLAPFTVYCDMTDKNGVGVTVISHDSESRKLVQGCETQGCYSRDIDYTGASLYQLASLTLVSTHCEQFIKYECRGSVLQFDDPYGWWVSRGSSRMSYWGGASAGSNKCACGMTNSCADLSKPCNCDKNDLVWCEDSGLLTDKSQLPVKQLRFGDTVGPKIFMSSTRLSAEEQQNISITCNATGQPKPRVTWSNAVGNFPENRTTVTNGVLNIYQLRRKDGGVYICKAKNVLGLVIETVQLIVYLRLKFEVSPPQEVTPFYGDVVILPCVAKSDLRLVITWKKDIKSRLPVDSKVLPNGTLVLHNIQKSHHGTYTCTATNPLATIRAKVIVNIPLASSCSVIKKHTSEASGNYVIDPDGAGGLAPFTVYCDMTDKNGVGVTVISHDSEFRI
ncbi:Contactin-associated protein 1 [Acropora cervicornis]|uniref:Contactin-associated protein 1 n=1 Tax=Acropora cervicornis TaxID=6130 RepID=A0AAD9V4G7_ACRCE|nr:Contactin-associated protein 1 [Acropora cervicornis]